MIPLQLILIFGVIFYQFEYFGICVFLSFIFVLFLQTVFGEKMDKFDKGRKTSADKRTSLLETMLSGIKNIKFNVWEDLYQQKCKEIRDMELNNLKAYLGQIGNLMITSFFGVNFILFVCFVIQFVFIGKPLLHDLYFLVLVVNLLSLPISYINLGLVMLFSGMNSFERKKRPQLFYRKKWRESQRRGKTNDMHGQGID